MLTWRWSQPCSALWRSALLGLVAWSCQAGSEDGHFLDREDRLWPALREDHGSRQLSDFTQACPNVRRHSLKACDKCLSNDMCPFNSTSGRQYICQSWSKRCADPLWGVEEVASNCPESLPDHSSWGAMCMLSCTEEISPFACSGVCLNEDFPCNWVPGCHAMKGEMLGMSSSSSACLRACQDHNSMLQVELKTIKQMSDTIDTCTEAVANYGCSDKMGARILELCPHTCRTNECAWRCGRDELPSEDGQQCWQLVERTVDQYSCAKAISEGRDCHCKCAHAYQLLTRSGGGAFAAGTTFQDVLVGLNKTVKANTSFEISLTGQAMRYEAVKDAWGPRLKFVVKGQNCQYATILSSVEGIQCLDPPAGSASGSTASSCSTPPSTASPYVHRWANLKVNSCGEYDVCHCNYQCDLTKSWHHAGSIHVEPQVEVGAISKALPGCERPVAQWAPLPSGPAGEKQVTSVTDVTLKIWGVIKEEHHKFALHAAKQALVSVLKAPSGLLNREVPEANDIVVNFEARRLFDAVSLAEPESYVYYRRKLPRRLNDNVSSSCFDDDAAFGEEANKLSNNMFFTCAEFLANLNDLNAMCADAAYQTAIVAGCQRTCLLCDELTTTTTSTLPPWLKGLDTMSLVFKITAHSDFSASNILTRLNLLRQDPVPYLQRLFAELENAGVPVEDIPSRLWVTVESGPTQKVVQQDAASEAKDTFSTTSILMVVLGLSIGGSCFVGILFVVTGYTCSKCRNRNSKVVPANVKEVTKVSEGGYRLKTTQVEEEVVPDPEAEMDCLEKCCARLCSLCYRRCCKKKLRKVKAWAQDPETGSCAPPVITIGSHVQLFGLSSAQYNGLTGTILGGPNDKGRFEVDLLVVNDYSTEEHQTISFKPANMRLIPKSGEENPSEATSPGLSPELKSYRKDQADF